MVNHLQLKTNRLRSQVENYENQLKRKSDYEMNDERIEEIKKKAEHSINEVKRQAHIEMQRAVIASENKASEVLKKERERHDKSLEEIKRKFSKENGNVRQEDNFLEVSFFEEPKKIFYSLNYLILFLLRIVGTVEEKQLKHVRVVKKLNIVASFANINIGKFCIINCARQ